MASRLDTATWALLLAAVRSRWKNPSPWIPTHIIFKIGGAVLTAHSPAEWPTCLHKKQRGGFVQSAWKCPGCPHFKQSGDAPDIADALPKPEDPYLVNYFFPQVLEPLP